MNTVMRTLGGALGGELSATFIAAHVAHGQPRVTGFSETFIMASGFLLISLLAGLLVPKRGVVTRQPPLLDGDAGAEVVTEAARS